MFTQLSRRRLVGLAVAAALAAVTIPSQALANDDPDYPSPPQNITITNPSVRTITEDALAAFRYSFAVMVSDPGYNGYPEGSLEARVRAGFLTLSQDRQALYVEKARQLMQAPPAEREREFGRHGRRSPEEVRRLGFDGLFTNVQFDRDGLVSYLRSKMAEIEEKARVAEELAMQRAIDYRIDPRVIKFLTLKKLNLRLDLVKCIDETDGFLGSEWGEDEIEMGGETVDHQGTTTKSASSTSVISTTVTPCSMSRRASCSPASI